MAIPWRQIIVGAKVWAPFGGTREDGVYGWRPAIVVALGKQRKDKTVVYLQFESGKRTGGKRYVNQLEPRTDDRKPPILFESKKSKAWWIPL